MNYKCAIFDMDGTLLDSMHRWYSLSSDFLIENGIEVDEELFDKLANMRAIYREWKVKGDAMWQKFNQKDVNEQAWYYTTIAKLTSRLSNYSAWIEYKTLTEIVFKKGV